MLVLGLGLGSGLGSVSGLGVTRVGQRVQVGTVERQKVAVPEDGVTRHGVGPAACGRSGLVLGDSVSVSAGLGLGSGSGLVLA